MPEITARELKIIYELPGGELITALNGFSAVFPDKSFNVIAGRSGCGKTTLLRAVAGLIRGDGNIYFDGACADDIPPGGRNAACVFQELVLYPSLTIFDNIAFPLKAAHMKPDEIRARVYDMAAGLGISHCLSRKPRHLSLGQQQLCAVARALVKKPDILLLDEPLSHIDPEKRVTLRKLIKSCAKDAGSTVLYVTHDIREATSMADVLFVMASGRLAASGDPYTVSASAVPEVRELIDADELNAFNFDREKGAGQ